MSHGNISRYSVLFEEFEQTYMRLLSGNKLEELLDIIANLAHGSCYSEINVGEKLFFPQLDAAIEEIAQRLRIVEEGDNNDEDLQIIIGSEFYTVGGHTPVSKALCRLAKRNLIIATDIFARNAGANNSFFDNIFSPFPVLVINRHSILAKTLSILSIIRTLRPGRIFCLNHHQDPVPLVAMLAAPKCYKVYYHHCDHQPALGASIDGLIHVDTNKINALICGSGLPKTKSIYAPIPLEIVPDFNLRYDASSPLNTICMGAHNKFLICHDLVPWSYAHTVAELLLINTGKHFHIGELSPESLQIIGEILKQEKIDSQRFIYCGSVPKGANLIKQIPNPVFIPSFPIGGGSSQIEMMAFGVPMLYKKSQISIEEANLIELQRDSYLSPSCRFWNDSPDLEPSLSFIRCNYNTISKQTRDHFLENLSMNKFVEKINAEIDKTLRNAS